MRLSPQAGVSASLRCNVVLEQVACLAAMTELSMCCAAVQLLMG